MFSKRSSSSTDLATSTPELTITQPRIIMMMRGCVIVNSGVLVAKSVELEDRFENIGAQLLREVNVR